MTLTNRARTLFALALAGASISTAPAFAATPPQHLKRTVGRRLTRRVSQTHQGALMLRRSLIPAVALLVVAGALTFWPVAGQASRSTQTLRFYDKQVSLKLIKADGTVVNRAPFSEPQPGDTLDANSLDYRGTHRRHAKRRMGSTHLVCKFGTGEPDCVSHFAIGGSMLVFQGNPGKVVNGTGKYQGATGRVVSSKQIGNTNDSDIVARIRLRR
jgi:hypothetical protein